MGLLGLVAYVFARYLVPSPINVRWRDGKTSLPTESGIVSISSDERPWEALVNVNAGLEVYKDPGAGYWGTPSLLDLSRKQLPTSHQSPRHQPDDIQLEVRLQPKRGASGSQILTISSVRLNGREVFSKDADAIPLFVGRTEGQIPASSTLAGTTRTTRRATSSNYSSAREDGVPTRGLVVTSGPLDQILSGRKTLELRSKHNRQLGTVALIRKGSGLIVGVADIVESIGPMDQQEMFRRSQEHCVEPSRVVEVMAKGWVFGWRLTNVKKLSRPVAYVHKGMSQVHLDEQAIEHLRVELSSASIVHPWTW